MDDSYDSLRYLLSNVTPREEQIIRMYFGIDEERRYTGEEIGTRFCVTKYRINQIFHRGLMKLIFIAFRSPDSRCRDGLNKLGDIIQSIPQKEMKQYSLGTWWVGGEVQ